MLKSMHDVFFFALAVTFVQNTLMLYLTYL
jgi:hypothetical protein